MTRCVLFACVAAVVATRAFAQGVAPPAVSAAPRVELRAAGTWIPRTTGGTVQSDYAPPLVNGTGTGRSSQSLAIESAGAFGYEFGARVRITTRAGVEFAVGRVTSGLSGINGPARLSLDYVALQPPDYVPRTYRVEQQTATPDTDGERSDTTAVVGAYLQWDRRDGRVGGALSGGLRLQRLGGAIRSLTYTEYRLGGHSTLFASQHGVEIEPDAGWCYAPYVAGELRVRLAPHARLISGVRLHLGSGSVNLKGRITQVLDPGESPFPPEVDTVDSAMGAPVIHASATHWRAYAGLAIVVK